MRLIVLVACAAVLAVATPAGAATVSLEGDGVVVRESPAEDTPNDILVFLRDGQLVVEDRAEGATLTAGDGCAGGGDEVTCERTAPTEQPSADVAVGNQPARIAAGPGVRARLTGGRGADILSGGDASDTLEGGDGPDDLFGGDGQLDTLYGGPGDDRLDGGEGADSMEGGDGADTFTDSGTEGRDFVTYFNDTTDPAGVDVSLDGVANDGNAVQDAGATDGVGAGIENVQGSRFGDDLAGGPGDDFLSGQGGDDLLVGNGGADGFNGAQGNDVLDARDGGADADLDCDNSMGVHGDADRALLDGPDPEPRNCETVERPRPGGQDPPPGGQDPPPGGQQQPPPPQQQGPPSQPPAGPQPGDPGVLCLPPPAKRCVKAADSYGRAVFPDLTGLTPEEAGWALAKVGIQARAAGLDVKRDRRRRDRLPKHPDGDRWKEGMVTGQSVAKATRITTGAGVTVALDLTLWEGPDRETCAETGRELAGLDLAEWQRMMREYGCRVDDVLVKIRDDTRARREVDLNSGDRCEVVRARRASGRRVDATLAVPDDPRLTDLRLGFKETHLGPSFIASEKDGEAWTLPVSTTARPAAMVVTVQDRTGALIDRVDVYVDATGAGGEAMDGETGSFAGSGAGDRGTRLFRLKTPQTGRVRLVAVASDAAGNALCGAAEVRVTDPGRRYATVSGNAWKRDADGWKRTTAAGAAGARAANLAFLQEQAGRLLYFLGLAPRAEVPPAAEQIRRNPDKAAAVREAFATHGATTMQVACGRPLSGAAANARTQAVASGLVATDGRHVTDVGGRLVTCEGGNKLFGIDADNDILADPSGLIGQDASTLIGQDGATLIGQDGSTLIGNAGNTAVPDVVDLRRAQIISDKGVGLISEDGATLIGNAGNTLVAATGAGMVAAGGGNMVAAGGAN